MGQLIVRRDRHDKIIAFNKHVEKVPQSNKIYIRYGQLNSKNKLDGVGVKITLVPKYVTGSETINGFLDTSYIEEGQFKNDQLDGTFGRRLYMNKTYKLGWFKSNGDTLHGFGIDSTTGSQGLFEKGVILNEDKIQGFDGTDDVIGVDFT